MENGGCVYDAVAPLTLSVEPDSPTTESYAVYRNEINSSSGLAGEVTAVDYFSLDVSAETPRREYTPPPTPAAASLAANGNRDSELAWFRTGSRFRSPMLQLHKEILDFCEFVSPTPEEQASRTAAVNGVSQVVKYIWPHCKVEVFGSFQTGLYLPTSDIDVVILESNVKTPQTGLYALAKALRQSNITKNMQVIAKARVPIVKFVEKQSGISFDISFDMESGPTAADFIKSALKKIPPLRPLCMILKVFLQQRELNEVYSGGIGSYALLAMLIGYLQIHWSRQDLQLSQQPMEHNLGILLVDFFDFYGRKLNNTEVGISCKSAGNFFLKSDKGFLNSERPFLLSIEDPQEPANDIGRNSFNYFKVKSAFSMAYSSLSNAKAILALGQHQSILGAIIRPDPVLLNRRGGINGDITFGRLLTGAGEPSVERFGTESDVIFNWHLLDDEPLPREKIVIEDGDVSLSRKKRGSKTKKRINPRNGQEAPKNGSEENGAKGGSGGKRKRRNATFGDEDGGGCSKSHPPLEF